jgi:hypothetical protein
MWGLAMIYHIESEIYEWRLEDRIQLVKEMIWKDYSSDFLKIHANYANKMSRIDGGDTPGIRQTKEWSRIIDEKSNFLSSLTYNKENYRMIEDMLGSNKALFTEYERIQQVLMKESVVGERTKGGSEESLIEQKQL